MPYFTCIFMILTRWNFVWGLSLGDVTINGEGLQLLTYARHSWSLSSEGFFFNVPHLLWHGATLYNGYNWRPVTLTPVAERLAVDLSLPILSRPVVEPRSSAYKANAIPLRNSGYRDVNVKWINIHRSSNFATWHLYASTKLFQQA